MIPKILHIDMNKFYASVEQMLNPQLKHKAIAVSVPSDGWSDRAGRKEKRCRKPDRQHYKARPTGW